MFSLFSIEDFLNQQPLKPSEKYLAEVYARKKPAKKQVVLRRGGRGRPEYWVSINYLKAARKAMAMAYWEAVTDGWIKRRPTPRQIAAIILEGFMEPRPQEVMPGYSIDVPGRFAYSTHAEYCIALQHYRYHVVPLLKTQRPIPGRPTPNQ